MLPVRGSEVPSDLRVQMIEHAGRVFAILSFPLPSVLSDRLSKATCAVLGGLLDGKSNAEIARERGVKERTVANQIARGYAQLGVGSRHELAAYVRREAAGRSR
jgi:DNA-binding NarL/FixJ family response regulator